MTDTHRIEIQVDSRDAVNASRNLNLLGGSVNSAERSLLSFGNAVRLAATSMAGLAFGKAIQEMASFETKLLQLKALTSATTEQMKLMEKQARELGATTAFSAQQAAQAQGVLASAGLKVNEIMSATPKVLQLAAAGSLDLAKAAEIATGTMKALGLGLSDLGRINDVFATVAANSSTNAQEIGEAMKNAAPLSRAFGVSLEMTAAAIGIAADNQIKGSEAGNNYKAMLVALGNDTKEHIEIAKKHGLTYADLDVKTRGLDAVMLSLGKANLSGAEALKLFGSDAAAMGLIMAANAVKLKESEAALHGVTGAAEKQSDVLNQGLTKAWDALKGTLSEAALQLGDSGVKGGLTDVIQAASGVISIYEGMGQKFKESNKLTDEQFHHLEDVAGALKVVAGGAAGVAALTTVMWGLNTAALAVNGTLALISRHPVLAFGSMLAGVGGAIQAKLSDNQSTIDKQIETSEKRIAAMSKWGIQNMIGTAIGFDTEKERTKLTALKQFKEEQIALSQKSTTATNQETEAQKALDKKLQDVEAGRLKAQNGYQADGNDSSAKKAAAAAQREHNKELESYKRLIESTPIGKYRADTEELNNALKKGGIDQITYNDLMVKAASEYEKTTVGINKMTEAEKERQRIFDQTPRGKFEKSSDELRAQKPFMTQSDYANKQDKIGVDYLHDSGQNKEAKTQIDLATEAQKAFKDELAKTTVIFDDVGNSGKMAFDGILGGISSVASAFSEFGKSIESVDKKWADYGANYSKLMQMEGATQAEKTALTEKYYKDKKAYESASFQAEISGARSIAGATAKMFSEKSAGRKAFHAIEMGLAVVEMAMSAKKMVVDVAAGAANMFAQSGWAGFAGVAAMAAVMGGLGFAMSGGSSKVSDNTTPATVATGTVLGDPTATSNSIDNIIKTLNDIHAQEYPELKAMADNFKGVDRDLYQMQRDIARSTANFTNMQGIGIPTSPTGAGQSKNPLGSGVAIGTSLAASAAIGATGIIAEAGLAAGSALVTAGAETIGLAIGSAAASSASMAAGIGAGLGATGMAATMIGGAILGLAGGLILAAAQYGLGKLLGIGKVKYQQIGEGIVIESGKLMQDGMATAVDASTWRKDIQTIKGWFSDKKTVIETYGQLSDEIYNALNSMTANLTYGMMNAAQQLGAWDALSYKFTETASRPFLKIDFWKDGKRVDDTNKVLTEQINAWMDRTATNVFGTLFGEYQKIGEGMMETVSRLAGEVAVVKGSFAKIHLSVGDSNLGLVTFSDTLVQMYASSAKADDGLKNFVASMNDLYSFTMSKGQQSQDSIQKSKDFLGADFNVYDTQAVKDRTLEITTKIAEAQQKATDAEAKVKALQQPVQDYWNPVTDVDLSKLDPVFKGILGTSNYSGFQWENAGGGWNETMIRNRAAEHPDNELWQNIVLAGDNNRALKAAGAAAGGSTQTIEQNQADLAAAQKASTDAAADVVVLTNSLAYLKDSASATASLLAMQSKYLDLTQTASEKTAREHADFIKENLSGLKDDLNKPPYSDTFKPILEAMGVFGKNVVVTAKDFQEALWKLENVQKAAKALADAMKYFDGFMQNIKSWIQNLKATQLGSPESQFNAAKDNFAAQMKIINGGLATSAEEKQAALSGITGVADTYIAAIKNNYASTKEGQDLINQVVEQISGLTTSVDVQQLQLGVLQQIRDGVYTIPTGISDTQKEFFTGLATKIDSAQKTYISAPTSQNDLMANTLAKEWTMAVDYATKGSGFLDAFIKSFDGKTGLDAAVNLIFSDKSLNPVQAQTAIDNVLSRVISLVNIEVVPRFLTTVAQKEIDKQIALVNPAPIYLNANNDNALSKIKTTGEKLTAYNGINVNKIIEIDVTSALTNIGNLTKAANDAMSSIAALSSVKSTPVSYPTALTPSDITNISPSISNLSGLGGLSTAANSSIYNAPEMLQTVTEQSQLMKSPSFSVEPRTGGGVLANSGSSFVYDQIKDPAIQAIIDSAKNVVAGNVAGGNATNAQNVLDNYKVWHPEYFANGGISDKPAIFGEAGAEAAVPLPDGRTIPVTLHRPASNDSSSDNAEMIKELKESNKKLTEQNNHIAEQNRNLAALVEVMQATLQENRKQANSLDKIQSKTRIQARQ